MDEADLSRYLDPRQVLRVLNRMGYTNITAQELKYFMIDLKKLIRYDLYGTPVDEENAKPLYSIGPEKLHSRPTISSKSKCVKPAATVNSNHCQDQQLKTCKIHSDETKVKSKIKWQDKKCSKSCKENTHQDLVEEKIENIPIVRCRKIRSSNNFIKVREPEYQKPKKSDPVSLYHYYATLWEKYKPCLPGENSWSDIRWTVRQKLLGEKDTEPKKLMVELTEEELLKRREGWIE